MNEASSESRWLHLVTSVSHLPIDLGGIIATVLVVDALVLLHVVDGWLGFALGLAVLLFPPGYVLIAILFPSRQRAMTGRARGVLESIDGIERAALSFATSLVVLLLYAFVIGLTPLPFSRTVVLGGLTVFIVAGAFLGMLRRLNLPRDERFRLPVRRWYETGVAMVRPTTRLTGALNILLLASIVAALGVFGYAIAAPVPNAGYTEFQLLTESESGDLVAGGYPSTVDAGEEIPLVAGVTNHQGSAQTYTVVVELQRVRSTDGSATVLQETELQRTQSTVAAGETWNWRHAVTPPSSMLGEDLRLQYTLYRGDAPADANADDAYRDLHLWITVDEGE